MTDRLKIGQEVLIHGYVDEIRKDTIIIQNEGGYFGTVECEVTDIEIPNTNEVLDKIRAEMLEEMLSHSGTGEEVIQAYADGLKKGLEFIDKYRNEVSE